MIYCNNKYHNTYIPDVCVLDIKPLFLSYILVDIQHTQCPR